MVSTFLWYINIPSHSMCSCLGSMWFCGTLVMVWACLLVISDNGMHFNKREGLNTKMLKCLHFSNHLSFMFNMGSQQGLMWFQPNRICTYKICGWNLMITFRNAQILKPPKAICIGTTENFFWFIDYSLFSFNEVFATGPYTFIWHISFVQPAKSVSGPRICSLLKMDWNSCSSWNNNSKFQMKG